MQSELAGVHFDGLGPVSRGDEERVYWKVCRRVGQAPH